MLIIVLFFLLLALGLPIAFVLGLSVLGYIFITGNTVLLQSLPTRMLSSLQNFSLLAIPMFVLVGELMNAGGITRRLIQFSQSLVGHFRGGLAYVNVVSNMFLASIIGSANAQVAMMSRIMIPAMEREGYTRGFSAALTASSSMVAPLIPPSMPFIIYGVLAGVSVGKLFIAGIVPGLLFGVGFMFLIYMISLRRDFPVNEKGSWRITIREGVKVLPALSIPIVILLGIISGVFTATESAGIAALMAFLYGFFLYREIKLQDLTSILLNTIMTSATVTFLIVMSNIFGWILTYERIPQLIAEALLEMAGTPFIFLILVNLILLLVGMFLEGVAALILLVPILYPIASEFGIDPIHFGVIMVINLTIGLLTPPVGTVLFITSSIGDVKLGMLIRSLLPFLLLALILLLLITYFPSITLQIFTWIIV